MLLSCLLPQIACAADKDADPNTKAFKQATEELVCFNFQVSYQRFDELLVTLTPDHPLYFKALLAKAICAQHITPPTQALNDEAISLFKQIAGECKDKQIAGRATMNLGRIAELRDYPGDPIDLEKARSYYQQVIDTYPNKELADEATLWKAGTYIQVVGDNASKLKGLDILIQWLAKRPNNRFASPMLTYMGSTYQLELNEPAKALDCYIKADKIGLPADSQISSFYWRMALLAEKLPNELDTCVLYYQKIIEITPTSGRAFEAQLALERLSKAHPDKHIQVPQIKLYQIGD